MSLDRMLPMSLHRTTCRPIRASLYAFIQGLLALQRPIRALRLGTCKYCDFIDMTLHLYENIPRFYHVQNYHTVVCIFDVEHRRQK